MTDQMTGQRWAKIIRKGATEDGIQAVIEAINQRTLSRQANQAEVIVACAQIMGQVVALGGPEIAAEMRQGVMAMIDGYSMQVAVGDAT